MMHCYFVSATVAVPVVVAQCTIDMWVPVLVAAIHVRPTMMVIVPTSAFDAIVKTLPLHCAKFSRRRIPPPLIHIAPVLRSSRICVRWRRSDDPRDQHQYWKSKPFESH